MVEAGVVVFFGFERGHQAVGIIELESVETELGLLFGHGGFEGYDQVGMIGLEQFEELQPFFELSQLLNAGGIETSEGIEQGNGFNLLRENADRQPYQ